MGVFDDRIHGSDVGVSGSGDGVGSGIAVKVDEGNGVVAEARVEKNVLEPSLGVELGDFFVEGVRVGLGEEKGAVGNCGNAFVFLNKT